ncbi:MAG: glycosyltransferase [Clostridiales bacterium]|nr:glycosyltransferase [Clostridiales bacterium]
MKVSVVIPVYNVGPYIGDAVRSVCDQTFSDLEIIVVDDCGTDDSMDRVRRIATEDPRIRIIKNPHNLGLAGARNRGLSEAAGDYVYFLDGDDMIVPDAISKLYEKTVADDTDAVVFEADFIYENDELKEKFKSNPARFKGDYEGVYEGRELFVKWMDHWDWMPSQPRFFYKRSFLTDNTIRYRDGMLHEDEIFTFDVLMNAKSIEVIKEPYFIRRFRASSIMTGGVSKRNVDGCLQILKRVRDEKAKTGDNRLKDAFDFYSQKIAANARGKIGAIEGYKPEVSVIIPVYNDEPYLKECIGSVTEQSMNDLEIIAVDDGSTDGSWKLLEELSLREPRLRMIRHEKNRGQSAARNTATDMATGRYIYFLDADDLILPETFEELLAVAGRDKADVVAFGHKQFTDDPRFEKAASGVLFSYEGMEGTGTGKEIFSRCVMKENLSPSVPTYFIKKSFIDSEGLSFIEGIIHEDIGYIYQMLTRSSVTTLVAKAYFLRRIRGGSTVTSIPDRRKFEGYIRSFLVSYELDGNTSEPAVLKWRKDVFGRIRQLYLEAGNDVAGEASASVSETVQSVFDVLKLIAPPEKEAEIVLGEETLRIIRERGEIYICSDGQYANRMIDMAASFDVVIKGMIVFDKKRRALRGIPVLTFDEISDRDIPVLLTISHFTRERYREALKLLGMKTILDPGEGF